MNYREEIITAKKYIDKLKQEYIVNHTRFQERDELIAENNIEKRDIKGYHGREILELLQNADDAYQKSLDKGEKPQCELKVTISYRDNILKVSNTGTCFDEDGIKAIVQGNNSPKTGKYIGNKGTGFRSVLNWAEKVRILSGYFNVEFSKEIAAQIFEENRENAQIKKQIEKNKNLYIPMLAVPKNIEDGEYNDITTIEVVIDPNKIDDDYSVSKQIENIDLRILLFLPNISQIDIITDDKNIVYRRNINQDSTQIITLEKIVDDKKELKEEFYLFEKQIPNAIEEDDIWKDIQLSIAVPLDGEKYRSRYLYSYFPLLDTESPFNCVLHASYALGDHRNTVNVSKANKIIIEEQLSFLVEVANKFVNKGQYDVAYNLLIPTNFSSNNWRFTSPFAKFETLEDYYLEMLSKQKIFRTVLNKNISIKDKPKMIDGTYPEFFRNKNFESLLDSCLDSTVKLLIETLAKREGININYREDELLLIINSLSDEWNVQQQVETFIWWNMENHKSLPHLLRTQEEKWLNYQEECYFLIGDFDEKGLPSWVKIPALKKEYQQELFNRAEKIPEVIKIREREPQISRILCQNNIFSTINFRYRDRSNIITTVNSSVDTYNKSVDFVKWLWSNYKKEVEWNPPGRTDGAKIKYNFPNMRNRNIQDSEKLYWGSYYNNDLAEKLFDSSFAQFPPAEVFNINQNNSILFQEFISKFGVKKYPVIEVQTVKSPLTSYADEYRTDIKLNGNVGVSTHIYYTFQLPYINNLESLLEKLSTMEIVEWIIKDPKLNTFLSNPFYFQDAKISYKGIRQKVYQDYWGKIKNYILEVFNEIKWIEIDETRFSPKQILQNFKTKNNEKFKDVVPILGDDIIGKIASKLQVEIQDVKQTFEKFSFANRITDLSSEDFYGLMLRLPELDFKLSSDCSRAIYRIVEQSTFSETYENSNNKNKFFQEGKLLVKYKKQLKYVLAKDAYLPSAKIISKQDVPIVDKGQRTNNKSFVTLFGCHEYAKEYTVDISSVSVSDANSSFKRYYQEFKKYARAYAESNDNIAMHVKKLNITLVNKIDVIEDEHRITIEEEYVCIRDKVSNWFITVFDKKFDINLVSEIIENIYTNIANTPGFDASKLGELFRTKDNASREFLIKKDFGTLSVIEDINYRNDIRNNFKKVFESIAPAYESDKIDINFDNFYSTENCSYIISLFKEIGTDIDEFIDKGFEYGLDLVPYYRERLKDFLHNEKRKFKDYLFTKAMSDNQLQKEFVKIVNRFENFSISEYKNSVEFEVENKVIEVFGEWRYEQKLLSADEMYVQNYETMNSKRLYEDEIANNMDVQRMIYFQKTVEFNEWIKHHEKQAEEKVIEEDLYSRYKDIVPVFTEVTYCPVVDESEEINITNRRTTGIYIPRQDENRKRSQKIKGNKGELLAYNFLCDKVGKENVFPRSEAFIELGLLKPGQAVSGEYDISYREQDGVEYFVEVKTGDGKSFIVSPGELQFAKENAEKYKLIVVYDIDAKKPQCMQLPTRFWEDPKFKRREIVERIEFEYNFLK